MWDRIKLSLIRASNLRSVGSSDWKGKQTLLTKYYFLSALQHSWKKNDEMSFKYFFAKNT